MSKVGKGTWLSNATVKMTNYWGALQTRAAKGGNGKGIVGGRGTEDPGCMIEEEGRRGGLQSKTPELGRRKGKRKGKGGKGIAKGRHYEEQIEARSGRGMGRRIQHQRHLGMEQTEERRRRGIERRMHYLCYKDKVPPQRTTVEGQVRWTWQQHMEDCCKVWQEGPKTQKLSGWWQLIKEERWKWRTSGQEHRIPRWEEEGVAEPYMMYHKPTGKAYAEVAFNGHQARLKERWSMRWGDEDLVSTAMRTSESMAERIVWPVERFLGQRRGHVAFWRRLSMRERFWAKRVQ